MRREPGEGEERGREEGERKTSGNITGGNRFSVQIDQPQLEKKREKKTTFPAWGRENK